MKIRIVKISDKQFVVQTFSTNWGGTWDGIQFEYSFRQKVVRYETWTAEHLQLKYCSFKSKDSAMKAVEKLKVYLEGLRKKDIIYTEAQALLRGDTGVVYECEI